MIILSLFLLHAIQASLCYDIELEGVMKVGKDFLRTVSEQTAFDERLRLPMPLSFASKGKLPKKAFSNLVMRAVFDPNVTETDTDIETDIEAKVAIDSNSDTDTELKTDTENETIMKTDVNTLIKTKAHFESDKELQDYVSHIKKKGNSTLRYLAKLVKKDIRSKKNITSLINAVTEDYVRSMQNYYHFATEDKPETQIDKEFIFLDLIETSSRLLYSEERKILNDIIIDLGHEAPNTTVQAINEKIYKRSVKDKKEEMTHVCNTYAVCRQYPAFTDYCADFISEILKLPENKFKTFLDEFTQIVSQNEKFFATMSEKEDRDLITRKLQTFNMDLFGMKEFFAVSRSVMTQRFKLVHTGHAKLKMRTKAMRILLDIIDKALGMEEDVLAIDFDTTLSALRSWSGGVRQNIYDIFKDFTTHIIRLLQHHLSQNALKEISVLISLIIRGTSDKFEIHQRLFKYGSSYVNGNDFRSELDIL